jgi:hypothetical protein
VKLSKAFFSAIAQELRRWLLPSALHFLRRLLAVCVLLCVLCGSVFHILFVEEFFYFCSLQSSSFFPARDL